MVTKEDLHRLVDELPDREVAQAARLLRELAPEREMDPFLAALAEAEEDDEPFTEEDRAALEEARAEFARGEFLTEDEVRRSLFGR
jgi:hypothetical protein